MAKSYQDDRPIRIAQIVQAPHTSGAIQDYFLNIKNLESTKYKWRYHIVKRDQLIKEIPHFIYGTSRKDNDVKQVVSQLQNMSLYNNKYEWRELLHEFDQKSTYQLKSHQFHPVSYYLNSTSPNFSKEEFEFLFLETNQTDIFFIKDPLGLNGKGLNITNDIISLKKQFYLQKVELSKNKNKNANNTLLVQKYIQNPLLLGNKKFDFRMFVLIFSTGYHQIYFYRPAYIRISIDDFDPLNNTLSIHSTHTGHAKKRAQSGEDLNKWIDKAQKNMQEFENMYKEQYNATQQDLNKIYFKIKQVLTYGFLSGRQYVNDVKGRYHLFGCDIMLDQYNNPWFIEANSWPDLLSFSNTKKQTMPIIINDMINLLMEFHENWDNMDQLAYKIGENKDFNGFDILYNEVQGYNILNYEYQNDPYISQASEFHCRSDIQQCEY